MIPLIITLSLQSKRCRCTKRGIVKTGEYYVVNELNHPELDSKGKVAKKTAALIALLENSFVEYK